MKGNTLNKQLTVLMFLLLNCFVSCSEDDNMILKTVTINLTEAGTLPDKISSSNKNKITNLKIIGDINGTDLRFIREMAGNIIGNGNLSKLDLSKAWIVEGGEAYCHKEGNYYYSSNNQLGCYAFDGCFSLTSINIPLSVTSIGDRALSCTPLENINIPSSVTEIGERAFLYCDHLKSVNIPSSVTELGGGAFRGCESLKNINIPSNVTEIKEGTFCECKSLKKINIPSSVTEIGDYAFQYCESLKNINIPSSVTEIKEGTFENCSSLESVNIPSNVTKIGYSAFHDCKSLRAIYVYAEKVPILPYNSRAFEGCDSKKCKVYVPIGTYDAYSRSQFRYFENIVEFDATSFRNTIATAENQDTTHYFVNDKEEHTH
ncbi:leucine-rich repeat domain-containing protein [Prevotellamassilia timonensis]|uniref:leucine-rich repeat domain-containing protein n=1 Tax=Prevotellamassilia timonensis TaxID=1852370 RepID=UPI0008DA15D2|nr:leucine-rich repeat domain-containing protein [Prevotellamassilia timonensis]